MQIQTIQNDYNINFNAQLGKRRITRTPRLAVERFWTTVVDSMNSKSNVSYTRGSLNKAMQRFSEVLYEGLGKKNCHQSSYFG